MHGPGLNAACPRSKLGGPHPIGCHRRQTLPSRIHLAWPTKRACAAPKTWWQSEHEVCMLLCISPASPKQWNESMLLTTSPRSACGQLRGASYEFIPRFLTCFADPNYSQSLVPAPHPGVVLGEPRFWLCFVAQKHTQSLGYSSRNFRIRFSTPHLNNSRSLSCSVQVFSASHLKNGTRTSGAETPFFA